MIPEALFLIESRKTWQRELLKIGILEKNDGFDAFNSTESLLKTKSAMISGVGETVKVSQERRFL